MQFRYYFFLFLIFSFACLGNLKAQVIGTADSIAKVDSTRYADSVPTAKKRVEPTTPTSKAPIKPDDSDSSILSFSRYFYFHPFEFNVKEAFHLDYDQTQCHQPDAVLKFEQNYYAYQATTGRSHLNLFFRPKNKDVFQYQPTVFEAYLFTLDNIKFYQLGKPYTELQYFGALGGEYYFNAIHSQNILPNWNVAFENRLISTTGYYANSSVLDDYMNVTTHFFTKNGRYKVKAAFIYNYVKQQENGGITTDSLFIENIQTTRDAIPVNLQKASTRWREMNGFVNQIFSLHKPDTVTGKGLPFNLGAIGYNIRFHRGYRIYSDQQPNYEFYNNFYLDSIKSYDSVGNWKLENTVFWTNDVYHDHLYRNPFRLMIGLRHQMIETIDTKTHDNLFNLSPIAKLRLDFGKLIADFGAEYTLGNSYNRGDYIYSGTLAYAINSKNRLKFAANLSESDPEYFYIYYQSNNFVWRNPDFNKERLFNLSAEYEWNKKASIGVNYYNYQNAVYLDWNITPRQSTESQALYQIYTAEKLNWGVFHFDNFAALQFSDDDDVFRLPLVEFKQSYYFQFWAFKKTLLLQTGFDLRYNTAYYGDAYSPALAAFYRQNKIETGNNLWLDVFVSGRIKRAFVFVKFTHVNALFDGTPSYYMIPHYPTQDFEFKWGFVWKFFD